MLRRSLSFSILTILLGCGGAASDKYAGSDWSPEFSEASGALEADIETDMAAEGELPADDGVEVLTGPLDRKIIFEADLHLIVDDFSVAEQEVTASVKKHGGYLAQASLNRTGGEHLSGRWVARIPVAQYDSFLADVTAIGVVHANSQTTKDVTEEYVDVEARIATKKKLEERILELLDASEGKISDVIAVEKELARVRSDIESMEGRLRYLKNLTSLTTVTIQVVEQRDYVPPKAPNFRSQIARAWESSIESLVTVLKGAVVAIVFLLPWLVVPVFLLCIFVWYLRGRWRRGPETEVILAGAVDDSETEDTNPAS